jgi:hypothetical protein
MTTRRATTARKAGRSSPATRERAARAARGARRKAGPSRKAGAEVSAWEDDPLSGGTPVRRPVPELSARPFPLAIAGARPPAKLHPRGSPGFRYWTAAEALRRAADFWGRHVPAGTSWQPGDPLRVQLDRGVDLNAYYDRRGLSFFHDTVGRSTVYSGESPDVLCHELGHAVLDALRPQLWDAMSDEVAAFHEAFGDVSALLAGLQLPSLRSAVLAETRGRVYRASRLSRLAEQLGWTIRQGHPDLVEPDCLRNAVNSLFYRSPMSLPPSGPSSSLSSEPHSFSRVFTGGFFEALANMLAVLAATPREADLEQASHDAAVLLVDAVLAAPIVPDYYSQVAAHLLEADADRFDGKYAEALRSAFVRRGILSLRSAAAVRRTPRAERARARRGAAREPRTAVIPALPRLSLAGGEFGLGERALVVQTAGETSRIAVASAAVHLGPAPSPSDQDAARSFVEYLFRRGRVDLGRHGDATTRVEHRTVRKTHELREQPEGLHLARRSFDCGFD